jgi:hypothetical protein
MHDKLYLFDGIIYQWNPLGLQAAALRVKDLHKALGVSRATLYNYFNGVHTPHEAKIPVFLEHAPECLVAVGNVQQGRLTEPVSKMKKPTLQAKDAKKADIDLLQSGESKRLLNIIARHQLKSSDGWLRFSKTYGPARVSPPTAYAILDSLKAMDVVDTRTVRTHEKGPAPLEIKYKGDVQWLLQ